MLNHFTLNMVSKTESHTSKVSKHPGAVTKNHVMEKSETIIDKVELASQSSNTGYDSQIASENPGAATYWRAMEIIKMYNALALHILKFTIHFWMLLSGIEYFIGQTEFFSEFYHTNREFFFVSIFMLVPKIITSIVIFCLKNKSSLIFFCVLFGIFRPYITYLLQVVEDGMDKDTPEIDLEPQGKKTVKQFVPGSLDPIEEYELAQCMEQEAERLTDLAQEKEVRKEQWVARHTPKDSARFEAFKQARVAKAQERARRQGRLKATPAKLTNTEPEGAVSKQDARFKERLMGEIGNIVGQNTDDYHKLADIAMQGIAMLSIIASCKNTQEVFKSIQGYLVGKLNVKVICFLETQISRVYRTEPQSDSDFTEIVARMRSSTLDLLEAPFGKYMRDILCITIVQGMSPKELFKEESTLHRFLHKMEKDMLDISARSYFETMFAIMEYTAGLVDALRRGEDWFEYICPTSLSLRCANVLAQGLSLKSGTMENCSEETMNELETEAFAVQAQLKKMLLTARGKHEVTASVQYQKITLLVEEILIYRKNEGFRQSPFMFMLFGKSQIGKTDVMDTLIKCCELGAGEEFTPDKVATLPVNAEYDDTIKSGTRVYKIDDMSAVKVRDAKDSVISKVLQMGNNVSMPTNQSAVERKANIYFRPRIIAGNTNVDHLDVPSFFNCPEAVYNRWLFVEVLLNKEFQDPFGRLDKDKANEAAGDISAPMHSFHPFYWKVSGGRTCTKVYIGDKPMPAKEFLGWFSDKCVTHFMQQDALEKKKFGERTMEFCELCSCPKAPGWCDCEPYDLVPESWFTTTFSTQIDDFALNLLAYSQSLVLNQSATLLVNWIQNYALLIFVQIVKIFIGANLLVDGKMRRTAFLVLAFSCVYGAVIYELTWKSFCVALVFAAFFLYNALLGYARALKHNTIQLTIEALGAQIAPSYLVRGTLALTVIATMRLLFHMMEKTLTVSDIGLSRQRHEETPPGRESQLGFELGVSDYRAEGNLNPKTMSEIEARAKERSDWDQRNYVPIEADHTMRTITPQQLALKAEKCLWKMFICGESISSNCFFVKSNLLVFPLHSWNLRSNRDVSLKVKFMKDNDSYETFVNCAFEFPEADQVILQVVSGPTMPDMIKYLSSEPYEGMAYLVRRTKPTLEAFKSEFYVRRGKIPSSSGVLPKSGLIYKTRLPDPPTEKGECGSPLISIDGFPKIIGFHCGGDEWGNAAASFADQERFHSLHTPVRLENQSGEEPYPILFDEEIIDPAPYDEVVLKMDEHEDLRHCIFHHDDPSHNGVTLRGYSAQLRVRGFSDLRETTVKPILQKLGYQTPYCLPRPRSDRDHAATFEKKMDCVRDIYPPLMSKALEDYTNPLLKKMDEISYGKRVPLTLHECLNGISESKFIGPIKEETSCGFGKKGKKASLVDIVYSPVTGEKVYFPKDALTNEVHKLDQLARQGRRLNSLTTTALKVEAVKAGPDGLPAKPTRIFFVMQMAVVLLQKKYFARVAEFLMSFPLLSECAAGINHTGPEWGQLADYLTAFGENRIIAGDYGGWDVRLSAQIMRGASYVMMRIAAHLGYSIEDITAMRVLSDEIANTIVCYNGAIISLSGWMISGAFITLILNSVSNSLVHRCAFFAKAFDGTFSLRASHKSFREVVHLATMGDDSVGGSKSDEFSMLTMREFCDSIKLKYTDANKNPVSKPFENFRDINFCKRQFRFESKLDRYLSPLELDSIMKPLNFWTPGIQCEESYLIQTVTDRLRELARHDEATFTKFHSLLFQCFCDLGLETQILELHWSYDTWLGDIRTRYFTEDLLN